MDFTKGINQFWEIENGTSLDENEFSKSENVSYRNEIGISDHENQFYEIEF